MLDGGAVPKAGQIRGTLAGESDVPLALSHLRKLDDAKR
jgi:hypothetical protein